MDKDVLIAYLNMLTQIRDLDKSFIVTIYEDEIDAMKDWCKQNHRRYKYSHRAENKTCYFYEILNS